MDNCRHEHPLHRDGQTQLQRLPQALDPAFFRLDERSVEDLLAFAWGYAAELKYFDANNSVSGNWQGFLEQASGKTLIELEQAPNIEPHFALFLCFLRLFGYAQQQMNTLTQRHLDYYYEKILQIRRRAPEPDQVHLVFELAKNAREIALTKGTILLAGKDDSGKALFYELTEDSLFNRAVVAHLRSVFYKEGKHHVAPVANSADGLGEKPAVQPFFWKAFGQSSHPAAPIGFAVAGPILRLSSGERSIHLRLSVLSDDTIAPDITFFERAAAALRVYATGKKGWIGPLQTSSNYFSRADAGKTRVWELTVSVPVSVEAIVPYAEEVHGGHFNTQNPALRLLFDPELAAPLMDTLLGIQVQSIQMETVVDKFKDLELDSSEGPLDSKKPFAPFGGIRPDNNSFFIIRSEEVFSKPLQQLKLQLKWQTAPVSTDGTFEATAEVRGGNLQGELRREALFPGGNNLSKIIAIPTVKFTVAAYAVENYHLATRAQESRSVTRTAVADGELPMAQYDKQPITRTARTPYRGRGLQRLYRNVPNEGLRLTLHIKNKPTVDNKSTEVFFIPKLQEFSLQYTAATPDEAMTANAEAFVRLGRQTIQFFQIGPFGQRETNGHFRRLAQRRNLQQDLLAAPGGEGQLLLGLQNLDPGQAVTLFFQVQEGSANPDADPPAIHWTVLANNYWQNLDDRHLLSDRTDGLIRSGIVRFIIPDNATTAHTFLEPGFIWLRAVAIANTDSVCRILDVHTQGAVARFRDMGNSVQHLAAPLAPGTISKLAQQDASVKKVAQPYPSFGGRPTEPEVHFYTRVAERLRHKQRAVSIWDYERLVLEQFPAVFQVKCISHCSLDSEMAPGNITLVVIPDYRHYTAGDPLEPRLPSHILQDIGKWVYQYRMPGVVAIHVRNPLYEHLLLKFEVAFKKDSAFDFGYNKARLNADISRLLSPWTQTEDGKVRFDGRYYRSTLIYALEKLEYVDYLTHFSMYLVQADGAHSSPLDEASASQARAILVPAAEHMIENVFKR